MADSLPALKTAVDHGANCVYLGLRDATNARNFAGLNFDEAAIANGIRYAHERGYKVFLALNTYPQASNPGPWRSALDRAVDLGVDAVILADPGLMQYAVQHFPQLRLHLSVQGSANHYDAINFYREQFGVVRAVLAFGFDVLRLSPPSQHLAVGIEVFDAVRRRELAGLAAQERSQALMPGTACNAHWRGQPGLEQIREARPA